MNSASPFQHEHINQLNQLLLIGAATCFICWLLYELIPMFRVPGLLSCLKVRPSSGQGELENYRAVLVR